MVEAASARASFAGEVKSFLRSQWFLTGIMLCLIIAYPLRESVSDSSAINPSWTLKTLGVIMIFVSQGVSLNMAAVVPAAIQERKALWFSLFCTFVAYPSITFGLVLLLRAAGYNGHLATGTVFLSIMPTTTALSTILTKVAGGDVPTAVASATLGNIAGVFVSPILAMLLLAGGGLIEIDLEPAFINLGYMVLLPFAFGQVLQLDGRIRASVTKNRRRISFFNHVVLLVIIFVSFANFYKLDSRAAGVGAGDLAVQIALGHALVLGASALVWLATWWMPMEQRIAALYVSAHKSVVMGLPMCDALFGTHPMASLFALPLILYYPAELATGTFMAPVLRSMVAARRTKMTQGTGAEPPKEPKRDAEQAEGGGSGGKAENAPDAPSTASTASSTAGSEEPQGAYQDLEAVVLSFEEAPEKPTAKKSERSLVAQAKIWNCLVGFRCMA